MRKLIAMLFTTIAALLVAGSATAATKVITVKMNGAQETPKGSQTGTGTAKVTLNTSTGRVCFNLTWSGIGTPTASHIHKASKGKAGPVVIPFFGGTPKHSGCVTAKKSLVAAIAKTPGAYYVNVHTAAFPGGAVRGQL
jgi:hypothetical protein